MGFLNEYVKRVARKFLASSLLIAIVLLLMVFQAPPAFAAGHIDADFSVREDGSRFAVTAVLSGITQEKIYIGFATESAGKGDLGVRIKELDAAGMSGKRLKVEKVGEMTFVIHTTGEAVATVRYFLNPRFPGWDHHFPIITSDHLFIPTETFIFETFADSARSKSIDSRVRLRLVHLPADWEILTTCPINSDGSIEIEGPESFIHAGRYITKEMSMANSVFTVAINKGLDLDYDDYFAGMERILRYQQRIFNGYPPGRALIVVYPMPGFKYNSLFGGCVVLQNAIMYIANLRKNSSANQIDFFLDSFAHETFHLWNSRCFTIKEDAYWFSEGFTVYQQHKTLYKTGLVDKAGFYSLLAEEYCQFKDIQKKAAIALRETGKEAFGDDAYQALNYHKGAIVAYLIDQELAESGDGRSFEGLMGCIYREYGLPGKSLGNRELMDAIDRYLGSGGFSDKWINSATPVNSSEVEELKPYIMKAGIRLFCRKTMHPPLPVKITLVTLAALLCAFLLFRRRRRVRSA